MNKKFLSAILFGALMVSSTGTFVSCKDYDDDIENLQGQINSNKDAIAALQKLVGEGKWVTNISPVENGFAVTMSDGTTTSITGIKGADGKDGTEWTIGEDGFWYKDGEKTTSQAIAKDGEDGKPGATAPSPKIDANGMWVVYEWDAVKGEFVEKTTEISAQGTSAYVVKKDGVYVLHIADETGKFQEVTLPATSDAFVVAAPGSAVKVYFEQANWTLVTSKADKEMLAKLTKEFPEIADYKKDQLFKQGGNLPILVTPANVEITDKFTFALQSIKGEISEATLSNPVKGMPANSEVNEGGIITTKAVANAEDGFWTLTVEPALNKKGDKYVGFTDPHSLIVKNEKGTVVKTGFAYQLSVQENGPVTVTPEVINVDNADAIDVFAKNEDGKSIFKVEHGMNGKFILEATEPIEVEKYKITIEGSKLMIGNMPADQTGITVHLKLTALGLNGSVAAATTTLTIGQEIDAQGTLADKTVTLSSKDNYQQKIRWNIADLGFSSVQLDQFLKATKTMKLTYVDEEGETQIFKTENISAYDKDGNATTDYKKAVTFGFTLDSKQYVPREYAIRLEAKSANSVIYAAEATLTVNNPTTAEISLAEAMVKDGVLQITGTPGATITYTMKSGFVIKKDASGVEVATNLTFTDMSATDEDPSWIAADGETLSIVDYNYDNVKEQKLYKTRHFKVEYTLFGNENNKEEMEFDAVVLSEIYNADATAAIKLNDMSAVFTSDAKKNAISIASNITSATYAAGSNRGKTYNLFQGVKKTTTGAVAEVLDYSKPAGADGTALTGDDDKVLSGKNFIEAPKNTDMLLFGFSEADLEDATSATPTKKYYITKANWDNIWNVAKEYYNVDGSAIKENGKNKEVAAEHKATVAVFNTYKSQIKFVVTKEAEAGTEVVVADDKAKAEANIVAVTVEFVNKEVAEKYATIASKSLDGSGILYDYVITAKSELSEDIPSGKVELPVKMTVLDKWGMKMVRTFNVTLNTK